MNAFEHVMRICEFQTQPMHPSQLRRTYYAVKDGRDGNKICTSWEDVRTLLTEAAQLSPTDAPSAITTVSSSGGARLLLPLKA